MRVKVQAVAVSVLMWACGGQSTSIPGMSFGARPLTIDDQGQRALLSLAVFDESGAPLGGRVTLSADAGDFSTSGAAACGRTDLLQPGSLTLDLDDAGTAVAAFSCCRSRYPGCQGRIRIDARWVQGDLNLEKVLRVTVGDGGI